MTGMTNLFISGKRWILHSRSRMAGGELGKYFLDPLQEQVRQDQWGSNCLSTGNCPSQTQTLNNILYTANFSATNASASPNLRKVKVDITWPRE